MVTTWEQVEGTYLVEAETEDAARAKFNAQRGKLSDWDRVEQVNYRVFDVQLESVEVL
jgi:hypothetical protein